MKKEERERERERGSECAISLLNYYNSPFSLYIYTLVNSFLNSNDKYIFEDPSSPTYGSLTIRNVSLADAGQYTCIVSNVHMTQSAHATLRVQCELATH